MEGLDKSGKKTQTELIKQYLIEKGYRVALVSFPRYETPVGQLLRNWLTGVSKFDKYTFEYLMASDKQDFQHTMEEMEKDGVDFLILDRYTTTQLAFSLGSRLPLDLTLALQRFMRKPDLEILLDISVETSVGRQGEHGDNDKYEGDKDLLFRVRQEYVSYFSTGGNKKALHDLDDVEVTEVWKSVKELVDAFVIESGMTNKTQLDLVTH